MKKNVINFLNWLLNSIYFQLAAKDEQIEKLLSELDQIRSMCSELKLQVNSVSSERDTLKNDYLILSDTHTLQLEESKTKMVSFFIKNFIAQKPRIFSESSRIL